MSLIVSTCGTSMLTNLAGGDGELRRLVVQHANVHSPESVPAGDRQALERETAQVEIKPIRGLRTDDPAAFREGVAELARLCVEEVKNWQRGGWRKPGRPPAHPQQAAPAARQAPRRAFIQSSQPGHQATRIQTRPVDP